VFDACQAGVALRAVLYVELALAVGLMFVATGALNWLMRLSLLTSAVLPATLLWLVAVCSLKQPLARLPWAAQVAAGMTLGALVGLAACAMLAELALVSRAPWLAATCAGALLAAGLVAGLRWRARGSTPAATAARLSELQTRIRPHFLFNALNSAIALVRDEPAKAEAVLEDLSDLFRSALVEHEGSSTVGQEIALARRYLDIEQVRFGPRLSVEWALDERANDARLPPLIMQPLVENAVKHGVEPSAAGARLRISTEWRRPMALIQITNTVPAGQGQAGHGLALDNVRDRLRLLHDLEGSFHTALRDDVYQARIEVPLK
jgi:two-component system sensor histidine kinase AlgZ